MAARHRFEPALVRAAFVILALIQGFGVLFYCLLVLFLPSTGAPNAARATLLKENLRALPLELQDLGRRAMNNWVSQWRRMAAAAGYQTNVGIQGDDGAEGLV